jgi:hypothetical protein
VGKQLLEETPLTAIITNIKPKAAGCGLPDYEGQTAASIQLVEVGYVLMLLMQSDGFR